MAVLITINQLPMKKNLLAVLTISAFAASAFAGSTYVAESNKNVVSQQETSFSLYPDREWTVDLFGTYAFTESTNEQILGDHAFGGGLAVNYFFTRNWGLGLEGQALKNQAGRGSDVTGSAALNLFYRAPIGDSPWAPYVYVGGGAIFNANDGNVKSLVRGDDDAEEALLTGHAGIGVEYRVTRNFGLFTDGRWTIVDKSKNNFPSVRTGIRFAF